MSRQPSLTTSVRIARSPKTVAEHVVLGLITGGLFGPGLVIDRREARCIGFSKVGGLLPALPDRGEIALSEESSGGTVLECRLWCQGMHYRRLLQSLFLGALAATVVALVFGWLVHISIPVGVAVGVAWDVTRRYRDHAGLRRRVEAFAGNTNYLKSM